jgi:putative FmdB family regulatory protein
MPIYQYRCNACGHEFEKFNKSTKIKTEVCEKCGKKCQKIISLSSFIINGYSEKNGYSKKG